MVNLFHFAEQLAVERRSLYRGIRYDRKQLIAFMEANDWFRFTPKMCDKEPYLLHDEVVNIRASLELWLATFKQSNDVKLDALLTHFQQIYPKTCWLYRSFSFSAGIRNNAYAWKLLDFMFSNISKEITVCTEVEIEAFICLLDNDASLASAKIFSDFLRFVDLGDWDYRFGPRGKIGGENGAYPLQNFSVMAYCVFNAKMWKQQRLIQKAAISVQYANLWLHTAMLFVCALRSTDMARLPAPCLPYEPRRVLTDILNNTFKGHFATALTDELTFRLKMKGMKPSKTKNYQSISEVKLFIPESLRVPLGTIMAIALAHSTNAKPGGQFIFPGDYRHLYKQFFGSEFVTALGNRQFSVRRSNKSYLQGIDFVASEPGKPKGYILAALARSHKGSIGTLPEITDIYLKDANFTGYSPAFIAREMFERGVFSFIPCSLLEIYAGEDFKRLSIQSQTAFIGMVGLEPLQIESLLETVQLSLQKARNTVTALISSCGMQRSTIGSTLQNIASGNAPSRMNDCLCLMTAIGQPCPYPNRAGCIGCGYEILTKSALQVLMREFERQKRLQKTALKSEMWRYTALLNESVLPAIAEIISCAKSLTPDKDISLLLDIIERYEQ